MIRRSKETDPMCHEHHTVFEQTDSLWIKYDNWKKSPFSYFCSVKKILFAFQSTFMLILTKERVEKSLPGVHGHIVFFMTISHSSTVRLRRCFELFQVLLYLYSTPGQLFSHGTSGNFNSTRISVSKQVYYGYAKVNYLDALATWWTCLESM